MTTKDDIDNLKTEAKILAETIDIQTGKFSESMQKHTSTLEQELNNSPYANVIFLRKFNSSFIDAMFAATSNLYLIAK